MQSFAELHLAMCELRRRAGNPSLRELQNRAGQNGELPHSTLGRILRRETVPHLRHVIEFAAACGEDAKALTTWAAAWENARFAQESVVLPSRAGAAFENFYERAQRRRERPRLRTQDETAVAHAYVLDRFYEGTRAVSFEVPRVFAPPTDRAENNDWLPDVCPQCGRRPRNGKPPPHGTSDPRPLATSGSADPMATRRGV